jgi:hypothetical protein
MFGFALPCAGMECRRPNEKGAMPNARAARTQVFSHPPYLSLYPTPETLGRVSICAAAL